MNNLTVTPSLDEYLDLAARCRVVPVAVKLVGDRETPLTVFQKLAGDQPGFLLESVEGGERWARWSFAGWDPAFILTARDGKCEITGSDVELPEGDPLEVLEELHRRYALPEMPGFPPLYSGMVGYLGYDCVRYVEHLPDRPPDDRGLPEMLWHFLGGLAAFDRFSQTITLMRNIYVGDDPEGDYREAVALLAEDAARLAAPHRYELQPAAPELPPNPPFVSTFTRSEYEAAVVAARDYVWAGDVFQVLPSQRLTVPFSGDSFDIYRALRLINPSPYLFYVRSSEVEIVGSSPELMTRVRNGKVHSRPIAGTRPRGATPAEDAALAEELLADPKERAEHVMLVDLARNDVGRVCEFGTVQVDELMVIERYSHVMHIVSAVSGTLRDNVGPVDALRATFPHGTVSGAPKVRAMEIIDELEPVARGPYAGAVGYIDFSGAMDTAICLRTVVVADGSAWVQAGGGVVADSRPGLEYEETMNKAAAPLAAIALAARG
ncbi:MAG: anthranilate synthase component I [Acidimicrobiia bacterium]|nr:anthranilate synthase component I [bacterium]MXX01799.1 anthranilate synthase component I [Acidimicrobiia bacterium]MXX45008.1 anthranilate synthase component I [Acidimicrobiia bacterium]MYA38664.1 anthranilate synthase component I [Acidimicrobiia bacterium]MYB79492.1 anthranilate synthase component I [Acidimicrobiia bacterium]